MVKRILIISSNKDICKDLQNTLQDTCTDVICAISEIDAVSNLSDAKYHMVIIDILPSVEETLTIVRYIRTAKAVPILMIAKKVKISDKILLFHAGVNILLEVPFNMTVFKAQVNSLIQLYEEAQTENREKWPLIFGTELIIDPIYRQVIIEGETLDLTRTEYELLLCLAHHPGQVWSRRQLYSQVWSDDLGISGENVVKVHIGNLRKKLADRGKNYIQTAWGVGYKFDFRKRDD